MGVNRYSKKEARLWYPSGPRIDSEGNRAVTRTEYIDRPAAPNPDPNKWQILEAHEEKNWLVVRIKYEGCTNYEGQKILVYKNLTLIKLVNSKSIDPHFFPNGLSPVARFVPTHEGWNFALKFIRA